MPTIDERELEDFLMEDTRRLSELLGLEVGAHAEVYRQFRLGSYGTADIVIIEPQDGPGGIGIHVSIIELKRGEIDINAFTQACRYCAGFKHHFQNYWKGGTPPPFYVHPVLIGSHLNLGEWVYAGDFIAYVPIFTYSLSLESGISFEEASLRGYSQTKPQFHQDFNTIMDAASDRIEDLRLFMIESEEDRKKALPAPEVSKAANSEWAQG